MKRKELSISIDKTRFRLKEAQAILSDDNEDSYNHPQITLRFRPEGVENDWNDVVVWLKYQRNMVKMAYAYGKEDESQLGLMSSPVYGYMDTAKCWGQSYAGRVQLDQTDEVEIGREFKLDRGNRLRLKLSGMIGKAISEYNLHAVTRDECERTVNALEKLGANVEWMYRGIHRDAALVRDTLYANEKARTKARERRVEADTVVLWTTAPESYDSGTTKTLEVSGLQNKKGDPWRKVAVSVGEVEWHRGRYGSGLYECQESAPEPFQIKTAEVETAN